MPNRKKAGLGRGGTVLVLVSASVLGLSCLAHGGPPCPCPDEVRLTKGDQYVIVEWDDPPDSLLYSEVVDTSGWSGHSVPVAWGFRARCDNVVELISALSPGRLQLVWSDELSGSSGQFDITDASLGFELADSIQVRFPLTAEVEDAGGWTGAVPTLGGFYVGTDSALYTVRAEASGTVASTPDGTDPGLDLYWEDSVSEDEGTLTVTSGDSALTFGQGLTLSFTPGQIMEDSTFAIRARQAVVNGESFRIHGYAFGGYEIWRSDVLNLGEPRLLKKIVLCELADSVFFRCDHRFYADGVEPPYEDEQCAGQVDLTPGQARLTGDVNNSFPYYYGVTTFDTQGDSVAVRYDPTLGEGTYWKKIYPAQAPRAHVSEVRVIPNPYVVREEWDEGDAGRVVFDNLPSRATIYVYNVVGELVIKLDHSSATDDFIAWNLKSAEGRDVVSGVYLYKVESDAGDKIGKFVVIR